MPDGNDIPTLRRILRDTKSVAVVGLSANWYRPSFFAAKYLIDPRLPGNPGDPGLRGGARRALRPERARASRSAGRGGLLSAGGGDPGIAEQAVAVGAKVLWMQLGIVNEEAARIARDGGLEVVMDRWP